MYGGLWRLFSFQKLKCISSLWSTFWWHGNWLLYRGCPFLGGSFIRGSLTNAYFSSEKCSSSNNNCFTKDFLVQTYSVKHSRFKKYNYDTLTSCRTHPLTMTSSRTRPLTMTSGRTRPLTMTSPGLHRTHCLLH